MSRTLYLIRHAETVNPLPSHDDLARMLTKRGEAEANAIGRHFLDHNNKVDIILHSPAVRTTQTAKRINDSIQLAAVNVKGIETIYHANPDELLKIIKSVTAEYSHVAMVGHNSAISYFASELAIEKTESFSPGMVVALQFAINTWRDIAWKQGELNFIYRPYVTTQ